MITILHSRFSNRDRQFARAAADRVHAQLYANASEPTPRVFVFNLPCEWMCRIFFVLCNIHGLVGFRDPGMRDDKAATIAPPALIRDTIEPTLSAAIRKLDLAMDQLTTECIEGHTTRGSNNREAAVRSQTDRKRLSVHAR